MALLISVLEQGLIYAIMAFGIYITYKILDFPDLTVDGSFPMGAAIAAALISRDVNPLLTLPICFLLGAVVGTLTGLILPGSHCPDSCYRHSWHSELRLHRSDSHFWIQSYQRLYLRFRYLPVNSGILLSD